PYTTLFRSVLRGPAQRLRRLLLRRRIRQRHRERPRHLRRLTLTVVEVRGQRRRHLRVLHHQRVHSLNPRRHRRLQPGRIDQPPQTAQIPQEKRRQPALRSPPPASTRRAIRGRRRQRRPPQAPATHLFRRSRRSPRGGPSARCCPPGPPCDADPQ